LIKQVIKVIETSFDNRLSRCEYDLVIVTILSFFFSGIILCLEIFKLVWTLIWIVYVQINFC